jgi:hypothetical protein
VLARSDGWKAALAQNGWSDLFLAGQDFRQFLLAEQARVEAVLQRLATAESARPAGLSLALTPTTLPTIFLMFFAGSVVAFVTRARGRFAFVLPAKAATLSAAASLLALPILFPLVGFVVSSTWLFATIAYALDAADRRRSRQRIALNLALGFVFSAVVFVIFGRGLGVFLPPTPGLGGLL